jgi:L-seryl-tRNA(Ser) seleniumtransferase
VALETLPLLLPAVLEQVQAQLQARQMYHLRRLINATGVIVHTNLGRSLLAPGAVANLQEVAESYSNLEYDLERGERGSRYSHVEAALQTLTGAEAALVVNNNAAAVFLALQALATGKEVIVSRGQLIEIGEFSYPGYYARSARSCVKGATNKTHLRTMPRPFDTRRRCSAHEQLSHRRVHCRGIGARTGVVGRTHQLPVWKISAVAHWSICDRLACTMSPRFRKSWRAEWTLSPSVATSS